ncbi:glycosyltransferase family 2 protein [Frateuria aurantia]
MLTIVAPLYNESAILDQFCQRLLPVLDQLQEETRVLFVDDGSQDQSWQLVMRWAATDARVGGIRLSRNFGKEAALTAGLDHVHHGAAIVIDTDLQDPPELIPQLVEQWALGFDVVYATRRHRQGETWLKKLTARGFYRLIGKLSDLSMPRDTGDFRLLSRRALDALQQLRERQRYMKGLFSWIGFRQTAVYFDRDPRIGGTTKWNYWRLIKLAIDGITSFSTTPLQLATWVGLASAALAFIYGVWVLGRALLYGDIVRGYPSLMVVILFLGGIQLLALGVIGEYLGRNYSESKQRPLYFVDASIGVYNPPRQDPPQEEPALDTQP